MKLHDRKPWILWFVNLSVEPEFTRAAEIIDKVLTKFEMKQVKCYSLNDQPCREYHGGEFIGVEKSITVEIYGSTYDTSLRGKIIDRSCKESEFAKSIYAELLKAMIEYFGKDAVT